ncbi:MAG: CapA family protein [Armatimonadota bacterium]|nr:CapA family protein [Armatimonadota bacterium]MDR7448773.1 CapA family protein [Armatimonadota bacterium]MDR7479655.1 CapA family protein [Armatimonadota bacterium]MDR7487792.1 CapA family protein [Armatimonadota bacterium]MDR7490824.1 CapA family protein [Armatimonadota bacterium]
MARGRLRVVDNRSVGGIQLLFVGDVMLGRLVNDLLRRVPPDYPWGDTLDLVRTADVRCCNLECVIADRGRPWSATPKVFHFRSDGKNVQVLQVAGIDVVALANNHTFDFEADALLEMLDRLDRAGIAHAGAGRTLAEATRPAVVVRGGLRVGVLAFTDNEPDWEAGDDRPGVWYVPVTLEDPRAVHLLEVVARTKAEVDVLVVSAHWGPNWGYRPPPEHPPFARALVDAGADIIFGHSGHVVRGVEFYRGRPILYCLGDFVDDYAVDEVERNDQSVICIVEWAAGAVRRVRLYPTVIRAMQASRADPAEAEAIAGLLARLCHPFGTRTRWDPEQQVMELTP